MTGVATVGCSMGIVALVLAGCSGRVAPLEEVGRGSGGTTTVHGSGGTIGASGGKAAGGTTRGTGGFTSSGGADGTHSGGANSGGANSGGANSGGTNSGGANSGGTNSGGANSGGTNSGGTNSGGAPAGCDYDPVPATDPFTLPTARVELSTVCGLRDTSVCRFSAAQLLEGYECSPDAGVAEAHNYMSRFHVVGCGNETVGWYGSYDAPSETFSLSTGELVGAMLSSGTNFGPCNTASYRAGPTHLDCPDAVGTVCVPSRALGDAGGQATCTESALEFLSSLLGRPECDCRPNPGVDPCFGPDSCECWCSRFVPAARACAGIPW